MYHLLHWQILSIFANFCQLGKHLVRFRLNRHRFLQVKYTLLANIGFHTVENEPSTIWEKKATSVNLVEQTSSKDTLGIRTLPTCVDRTMNAGGPSFGWLAFSLIFSSFSSIFIERDRCHLMASRKQSRCGWETLRKLYSASLPSPIVHDFPICIFKI